MKTVLLTIVLASVPVSLLAQGTIGFVNTGGSGTLAFKFPIYGPELANNTISKSGNSAGYTGPLLAGSGFSAQLFGAPGNNVDPNLLVAALPISPFRTGTAAGYLPTATATIGNVPGDTTPCTVQLRVWDNHGGQYATWTQAYVAWLARQTAVGMSTTLNFSAIGGVLVTPPTLLGMQSFNIYYYLPEPSSMALAGLGVVAWLISRRRG